MDYFGFDINPDKFTKGPQPGVQFVLHDITKPFPDEYREKFDLVHVRLLVYAVAASKLAAVVQNIVQILRRFCFYAIRNSTHDAADYST